MSAIDLVIRGRPRAVGNEIVLRLLPHATRRAVGPFVFLDHMGPSRRTAGEGFDVPPHPHIGLATVTYLFDGELVHRDSIGSVATIRPGAVNLMKAGSGVAHSERSSPAARAEGATLHGLQLWLGLPLAHEDDAPSFAHHDADALPLVERLGVRARVVLGRALGATSPCLPPARAVLVDLTLAAGAALDVPTDDELAVYVVDGDVEAEDATFSRHVLLVRTRGATLRITARTDSRLVLLGGPPLDGAPRLMDWNFVASSRDRIDRAKVAWRAGTFPVIPGEGEERVPLPEETPSA